MVLPIKSQWGIVIPEPVTSFFFSINQSYYKKFLWNSDKNRDTSKNSNNLRPSTNLIVNLKTALIKTKKIVIISSNLQISKNLCYKKKSIMLKNRGSQTLIRSNQWMFSFHIIVWVPFFTKVSQNSCDKNKKPYRK